MRIVALVLLALGLAGAPAIASAQSCPSPLVTCKTAKTVAQTRGEANLYDYITPGAETTDDSASFQQAENENADVIVPPRKDGLPWRAANLGAVTGHELWCVGGAQIRPPMGVAGPVLKLATTSTQLTHVHDCVIDGDKAAKYSAATAANQAVEINQGISYTTSTASSSFSGSSPLSTGLTDPHNRVDHLMIANFTGDGVDLTGRGGTDIEHVNIENNDGQYGLFANTYDSNFNSIDIGGNAYTGLHCDAQYCAHDKFTSIKVWGSGNGVAAYGGSANIAATANQLVKVSGPSLQTGVLPSGSMSLMLYYFHGTGHNGINPTNKDYCPLGTCDASQLSGAERRLLENLWINGDPSGTGGTASTPPAGGWQQNVATWNWDIQGNDNLFSADDSQDGYFGQCYIAGNGNHGDLTCALDGFNPLHPYSHRCMVELDGGGKYNDFNITVNDASPAESDFAICNVNNSGEQTGSVYRVNLQGPSSTNTGGIGDNTMAKTGVDANGYGTADTITFSSTGPANGDTITINGVVYTFDTTLSNVAGHVHADGTSTGAATNLVGCMTLSGATAGTDYASACAKNKALVATKSSSVVTIDGVGPQAVTFAFTKSASNTAITATGGKLTPVTGITFSSGEVRYNPTTGPNKMDASGTVPSHLIVNGTSVY